MDTKNDERDKKEINVFQPIEQVAKKLQSLLGFRSIIDRIIVNEGEKDNEWHSDPLVIDIFTDQGGKEYINFIHVPGRVFNKASDLTIEELHSVSHEVAHSFVSEVSGRVQVERGIRRVLDEGLAEMATCFAFKNELVSSGYSIGEMRNKWEGVTKMNKQLITDIINNPGDYDSVSMPAGDFGFGQVSMLHVAGYNFVSSVLNENNFYAWLVLWRNPPTTEEVFEPEKYKSRVAEQLSSFPIPAVLPKEIKIQKTDGKPIRLI